MTLHADHDAAPESDDDLRQDLPHDRAEATRSRAETAAARSHSDLDGDDEDDAFDLESDLDGGDVADDAVDVDEQDEDDDGSGVPLSGSRDDAERAMGGSDDDDWD